MIRAIVTRGQIVPREPLPEDWREGTEVAVDKSPENIVASDTTCATDVWIDEVEAIAQQGDDADDQRLEDAIRDIRRRERDTARCEI